MKFSQKQLIELTKLHPNKSIFKDIDYDELNIVLSKSHYENFPVASILIPKRERQHFYSIYSFSRIADDLSDELQDISIEERQTLLDAFYNNMISNEITSNPIFIALRETKKIKEIDNYLFYRLITAFKIDLKREGVIGFCNSYEDNIEYCYHSANPIGELLLILFNEISEDNIDLSNKICTSLQLINFWQDISVDSIKQRNFIPNEVLLKYNIKIKTVNKKFTYDGEAEDLYYMLTELYNYTEYMMFEGKELVKKLKSRRLRAEIALIVESGLQVLAKIRNEGINIFDNRVKLTKFDLLPVLFRTIILHRIVI